MEELDKAMAEAIKFAEQFQEPTLNGATKCKVCLRWFRGRHDCIGEHNEDTIARHMAEFGDVLDKQFRKGALRYEAINGRFESHDALWYLDHCLEEKADDVHYTYGAYAAVVRLLKENMELKEENLELKEKLKAYERS